MTRSLVLAFVLATAAAPAIADAKPRVAFAAVEGDPGGEIADYLSDVFDGDYDVVGAKEVGHAEEKLGYEGSLSDKQAKKLGNAVEADALVLPSVSSRGANRLLHFKLYLHGKKVKGFKVEYASLKSAKLRQVLHDKLVEKLALDGEDAGEVKPADKADKGGKPDKPDKTKPKVTPTDGSDDENPVGGKAKPDDKADDDGGEKPDDSAGEAKHPHGKKHIAHAGDDEGADVSAHAELEPGAGGELLHAANRDAVRVDLGVSLTARNLSFNSRPFDQAPKGYSNSPVPGARFDAELYPFAFGNPKGIGAAIGIAGEFDQTFGLSLQSTAQAGTKFPVTERHYDIGLRIRIPFGGSATAPTLTAGIGYAQRSFVVDRSALMPGNIIDLPDVDYAGFDPSLVLRVPLGHTVALLAGGGAILVTSAGQIQDNDQYGQAKVTAGQLMAGLDFTFGKDQRYAVRVVGEFVQVGFAFTGNGAMTNDRDGDPTTPDVGGATDRYYGGAATFAVLY